MVPMLQWNSNIGDLFPPRPALFMGTSPPSGHAGEVTESAGPAGPRPPPFPPPPPGGPPFPPAGACAMIIAQDARAAVAKTRPCFIVFILVLSSIDRS